MDSGTISISIGDARSSTCLVLPRSHELVRQIQSLLPANALAQFEPIRSSPPVAPYNAYPSTSHVRTHDPIPQSEPTEATRPGSHRSAAVVQALLHRPCSPLSPASDDSSRRATVPRGSSSSSRKKRCQVVDCGKISVSQGLCRAHGGGRRCLVEGCSKGAQSRGDYCWSHGGGHRCEVPGCMRSRKTKRFCNAHVNCGSDATQSFPRRLAPRKTPVAQVDPSPPRSMETLATLPRLPSLHLTLQQPFPREPSPLRELWASRPSASSTFSC